MPNDGPRLPLNETATLPLKGRFLMLIHFLRVHVKGWSAMSDHQKQDLLERIHRPPSSRLSPSGPVASLGGVESMHYLLDVEFGNDLSRYRTGRGPKT